MQEWQNKKVKQYLIVNRVLGTGQFGKVYLAFKDEDKNQQYAAKSIEILKTQSDKKLIQILKREIEIMKKLQGNPYIVNLESVIQTNNNLYLFMELCLDGDLKTFMDSKPNKRLTEEEAVIFLKHITEGFKELQNQQIIHRDIKPANIMLSGGVAKIADFGFSRIVEQDDKLDYFSRLGSPLYMAPQILKGEKFSSKCDVWSVGIMLYEMLYGYTPWTGTNQVTLIQNMCNQSLSFPEKPLRSQQIKDLITGMLQQREDQRMAWNRVFEDPVLVERNYLIKPIQNTQNIAKSVALTNIYIQQNKVATYLNEIEDYDEIPDEREPKSTVQSSMYNNIQTDGVIGDESILEQRKKNMTIINKSLLFQRNLALFLCFNTQKLASQYQEMIAILGEQTFYQLLYMCSKRENAFLSLVKQNMEQKVFENYPQQDWIAFQTTLEYFKIIKLIETDIKTTLEFHEDIKKKSQVYVQGEIKALEQDNFENFYQQQINNTIKSFKDKIGQQSDDLLITLICLDMSSKLQQYFISNKKFDFACFYEDLQNKSRQESIDHINKIKK